MWMPHCETDRAIEADCRSAVARAEKTKARVKKSDWLIENIPHPEEDIEEHPEWAARYERWKEAREREEG